MVVQCTGLDDRVPVKGRQEERNTGIEGSRDRERKEGRKKGMERRMREGWKEEGMERRQREGWREK